MEKLLITISRLRQKENYSQAYMAFRMRISQKQYSYIEAGKSKLKLADILLIAKILEINPIDLLEISGLLKEFCTCEKDILIEVQCNTIKQLQLQLKYSEMLNSKLLMLDKLDILEV